MEIKDILVERWRPSKIEDLVLSQEHRDYFNERLKLQDIPHLLFVGSPGTGKTTLAKILVSTLDVTYRYINASDSRGIDDVRQNVIGFAETKSFDGKFKVVILDECLQEDTVVWVLRKGNIEYVPIKDLNQSEDLVKSYNFKKNCIEWRTFELFDKGMRDVYEIEFENGENIVCTGNHKWYICENGKIVRKTLDYIREHNITEIISP